MRRKNSSCHSLSSSDLHDNFALCPFLRVKKTGRNDPCPCGSGKKYKQCCLKDAVTSEESPWSQQRDASGWLVQQMLNFARQRFANDLLAAWLDFNQDDSPVPIEEDPEEGQIFVPYYCSTGTRNHARAGAHPSQALSHNPIC